MLRMPPCQLIFTMPSMPSCRLTEHAIMPVEIVYAEHATMPSRGRLKYSMPPCHHAKVLTLLKGGFVWIGLESIYHPRTSAIKLTIYGNSNI
jgi:hypothetical protein